MSGYQNSPPDPYRHYPPPVKFVLMPSRRKPPCTAVGRVMIQLGMVHHQDTHLHRHHLSHNMKPTHLSCHLGTHMLQLKVKVIRGILMEVGILLHHPSNSLLTRCTSMMSTIITVMIITIMVPPSYRDVWLPSVAAVCLKNAATELQWMSCLNIWDPVILSGLLDV